MTGTPTALDQSLLAQARLDAALDWHVRLDGEPSAQDWQDFTAWLESDPAHRTVFDEVDALSADAAAALPATADIIAFPQQAAPAPSRRRAGLWVAAAAIAASVALVFIAQRASVPVETYVTKIGETRDVTLADGSVVHLNTDTKLTVDLGTYRRDVILDKGEALFEVSADAQRPFIVAMGPKRVRVVGTAFNVLRHEGRIVVSVEHGKVQVSHQNAADEGVALSPGDRYIGSESVAAYQLVHVDPAVISAWRDGRLVFDDAPLSQVVTELNRYFAQPVVVPDADVQNLRFSGILRMDEESAVLRRLAAFLPITVQSETDRVILLRGSNK